MNTPHKCNEYIKNIQVRCRLYLKDLFNNIYTTKKTYWWIRFIVLLYKNHCYLKQTRWVNLIKILHDNYKLKIMQTNDTL